jgi:hypothetical protein
LPGAYRFPLYRDQGRELPVAYGGPLDVWDIDQTYLDTRFRRIRDLIATALESADQKRARPGVVPLLRALRRGAPAPEAPHPAPLYFISASPPQMRAVLEEKMRIDGIDWDGITLKDHLGLLAARRLREIRRHIAYKLTALLLYRAEWPTGAREWLYGDDGETDALIYSLYADIRSGALGGKTLDRRLEELRVSEPDRKAIDALAVRANVAAPPPEGGSVEAIYIFRTRGNGGPDLRDLPRVRVVQDAAELARELYRLGRIADGDVEEITLAVRDREPL